MKTKLANEEMIRLQKIADKLQFAGYGGSLQNQRSADGDVKLLRKIIAMNKTLFRLRDCSGGGDSQPAKL